MKLLEPLVTSNLWETKRCQIHYAVVLVCLVLDQILIGF